MKKDKKGDMGYWRKQNQEYTKRYKKQYREKNKEKIKKYSKKWRQKNKAKIKKYMKKHNKKIRKYQKRYYQKNREKLLKYQKEYCRRNKRKRNKQQCEYNKEYRKINVNFKITCNLRNRLNTVLKHNSKSKSTLKLLGCTIPELKQHLEKKFTKGMTWDNYGKGKEKWVIDHKRPCASFDLSNPTEQRKCFHYTNLQPLWAKDNIRKGDNFIMK